MFSYSIATILAEMIFPIALTLLSLQGELLQELFLLSMNLIKYDSRSLVGKTPTSNHNLKIIFDQVEKMM